MKKLLIFGTGGVSEVTTLFFSANGYEICAYCNDDSYVCAAEFCGKPVVPISQVLKCFPPTEYSAFVAIGFLGINRLRAEKVAWFRSQGYHLASYVAPGLQGIAAVGDNCFIMNGASLQPFAAVGNNVFIWDGVLVGHHSQIGDDCWFSPGSKIAGNTKIGKGCFFGVGAIVGNDVEIGAGCMLGAGAVICRSLPEESVHICPDTPALPMSASRFASCSPSFRIPADPGQHTRK